MRKGQKESAGRHGEAFWEEEKGNFGLKMLNKMGWEKGKGLGKKETGTTQCLKAKWKGTNSGIGADKRPDDTFVAAQSLFNDVLKRLNEAHASGNDAADPIKKAEEDDDGNTSKNVRSFIARKGLYGKFRRSKDLSSYSESSLSEIFGRKNKEDDKKLNAIQRDETPASAQAASQRVVDALTHTSSVSMRDYFAKKLTDSKKKVTRFQSASGFGFSIELQSNYYQQMTDMANQGRTGLGFAHHSTTTDDYIPTPREERPAGKDARTEKSSRASQKTISSGSQPDPDASEQSKTSSKKYKQAQGSDHENRDDATAAKEARRAERRRLKAAAAAGVADQTPIDQENVNVDDAAAAKAARKAERRRLKAEAAAAAAAVTAVASVEASPSESNSIVDNLANGKKKRKKSKEQPLEDQVEINGALSPDQSQTKSKKKKKEQEIESTPVVPQEEPKKKKKRKKQEAES